MKTHTRAHYKIHNNESKRNVYVEIHIADQKSYVHHSSRIYLMQITMDSNMYWDERQYEKKSIKKQTNDRLVNRF